MTCDVCKRTRRVCENHHDKSWPYECDCGPGMLCPKCGLAEPSFADIVTDTDTLIAMMKAAGY